MVLNIFIIIIALTVEVATAQSEIPFKSLERNRTHKFERSSLDKTHLNLYYRISSKSSIINENKYWSFNFSEDKHNKDQLVRFENNQLLIATNQSLKNKGAIGGESVLFDFAVPIGTTWLVDIENSDFISTSIFEFKGEYYSSCLDEIIFIFDVTESIKVSHMPYFARFYVSKNYGILGAELERESYPTDTLVKIYRINPLLKKLDCDQLFMPDASSPLLGVLHQQNCTR